MYRSEILGLYEQKALVSILGRASLNRDVEEVIH